LATGQVGGDELEEIEGHLEDSMTELEQQGLSEREAFLVAANRMGNPVEIGEGFEKMGLLSSRLKILLYIVLGGILVPLPSLLSSFFSGVLVFSGSHAGLIDYEAFDLWLSATALIIFVLLVAGGSWLVLSRRSPIGDWLFKVSASRWLLGAVFMLNMLVSGMLASGTGALRQLALRELTPSEHSSHLPGSFNLSVNLTEFIFWVVLTIAIPLMVRREKETAGIL
jgi:hypothetical protein